MKTGLIMEGGAMRGMFTCGVIDVFMEHGIEFDGAIGVSAGAVFGSNYKSRQIGRPIRYNKRFCADKRYGNVRSFLKTGDLFDEKFCYHTIPYELDPFDREAYQKNPMEFYVTCTDIETGKAIYKKCMDGSPEDIEWMRASASMPIVSRVVEIHGRKLLDGGISDSIPLRFFEHKGYNRNVVILTQPLEYRKKKNKLLPMAHVSLRKYPNIVAAIANRHTRYNRTLKYIRDKELKGEIFVIRPLEALHIHSTEKNPSELERVYQIGRKEGMKYVEDVRRFLK